MKYTANYNFALPQLSDYIDTAQYNNNFTVIDTKLKAVETLLAQVKNKADTVDTHKHEASDVTSGVFAEARIPILAEAARVTGNVGPFAMDQAVGQKQSLSFTIPFSKSRTTLPKRVRIWFGAACGTEDAKKLPADKSDAFGEIATLDIIRSDTGALSAWTDAGSGTNVANSVIPRYRRFYATLTSNAYLFEFHAQGSNGNFNRWSGYGGRAFTDTYFAQEDGSDATIKPAYFFVRFISMTSNGITLQIYNSTDKTQIRFGTFGYVFD